MADDMNEVIAKIQKILARTTQKGASEEEAASAVRIAQSMMAKYNLDMAEIEAASEKDATQNPAERVKEEFKGRARFKWQRQLAKYVAEANFCYHLVHQRWEYVKGYWGPDAKYVEGRNKLVTKHIFVGRKANVITAQLMYQYLTQAVEDNLPVEDHHKRLSRSANSWKEGCADRLCEKLAQKRRDIIKEHDAKVKAAEAAARAKAQREYDAKPKMLEGNREVEVKARVAGIASDAYDMTDHANEPIPQEEPAVDAGDDWNPANVVRDDIEEDVGTAMVLASEYSQAEEDANREVANGWPPGTIAGWRKKHEEEEQRIAEAEAKREMGEIEAPVKDETERQKRAREKAELDAAMKRRRRWAREDAAEERKAAREWAKKDHKAYYAGASAGEKIGIDVQVKSDKTNQKLLGK